VDLGTSKVIHRVPPGRQPNNLAITPDSREYPSELIDRPEHAEQSVRSYVKVTAKPPGGRDQLLKKVVAVRTANNGCWRGLRCPRHGGGTGLGDLGTEELEDPRCTTGLDMISYSLTGTTLPSRFGRAAGGDGDHRLLGRLAFLIRCPVDGEASAAGAALKPRASLGSPNSLSSGLLRVVL
jgi:hypothetical protein